MLGEAYPGDTEGMTAVGNTVLNRLSSGRYGHSITRIVKAPNQYAAWGIGSQAAKQGNNPSGRFPESSPQFQAALALAQKLTAGEIPDNTQGATDYRAASLGTRWAHGANTVNIGGNVFKVGSVDPTGLAYSGGGNAETRRTQQALDAAGFNPGGIDGVSGPRTKAAIRAFQRANGLTVDGIAGPQTQTVLAASAKRPNSTGSPDERGGPAAVQPSIRSIEINPNGTAKNPADEGYNVPAHSSGTRTQYVSPDGTVRDVQQAGSVAMPPGARPASVGNYFAAGGDASAGIHLSAGGGFMRQTQPTPSTVVHTAGGDTRDSHGAIANVQTNAMSPSAPAAPQYTFNPAVQQLQQHLGIKADGFFGPQTDAAVRQFQAAHGLTVDGIVGSRTIAALTAAQQPAPQQTNAMAAPAPTSPVALPQGWVDSSRQGQGDGGGGTHFDRASGGWVGGGQ